MLILALLTIAPVGYLLWQRREQPAAPKHLGLTFVGGILVWLATMSWPLSPRGDYLPWQVILAGAAMVALTIALAWCLLTEGAAIGWTAASGFALAWGVWAGLQDDTGLWGVGLIMVLLGAGTSLALVGWLTGVLRQRRAA